MIWKAIFLTRKYTAEESISISYDVFGKKIQYYISSDGEGSKIEITFDTEVSKPPLLQQERAEGLLALLKEVTAPYIMDALDAELIKIYPADDESRKQYDNIEKPSQGFAVPNRKLIDITTLEKIKNVFTTFHHGGPILNMSLNEEAKRHNDLLRFEMILGYYNRSMDLKETLNKFISLWVTFNMLYDFFWVQKHPECDYLWTLIKYGPEKKPKSLPKQEERITFCFEESFKEASECKEILEPHRYALTKCMWQYELGANKDKISDLEVAIKSKNIIKIEEYHERSLEIERKENGFIQREYANNKKGLDFGKYWLMEDWVKSLEQVLLHIYGLRNNVFHSGEIPSENGDPSIHFYWIMVNDVLTKTNALLIQKWIEQLFT
jgi:hypothetical protein